LEGEVGGGKR
jgi:hypothetical protein